MGRFVRRLLLLTVIAGALYAGYEFTTWPDVGALAHSNPKSTAFIDEYRAARHATGEDDRVRWTFVPYARIAPNLKRAVLVAEDIDFFAHQGFDLDEMKKAFREAWDEKEFPRGASTISQQLVKNLYLSPSRNPLRKVKEAMLTRQVEKALDKRRILELYLNVVETGPGIYGAEAAARHWFGKSAADLDEHEAALIAASLPRPKTWHPGVSSRGYARRAALIEARMQRAAWLMKVI